MSGLSLSDEHLFACMYHVKVTCAAPLKVNVRLFCANSFVLTLLGTCLQAAPVGGGMQTLSPVSGTMGLWHLTTSSFRQLYCGLVFRDGSAGANPI